VNSPAYRFISHTFYRAKASGPALVSTLLCFAKMLVSVASGESTATYQAGHEIDDQRRQFFALSSDVVLKGMALT
jgi:hypothetical protein